ncbi:MAG: dynamin family protein [Corynebacterium sp.]|nr:dynamin family protein [Corynebacterium sp.]
MTTQTQRTPVESVARAAEIARRYGKTAAADRALKTLKAEFRAGTVVVIGEVKRGKSSLVNALIGCRNLLPVDVLTCTSAPIRVTSLGGDNPEDAPPYPQVNLVRGAERQPIDPPELYTWVTQAGADLELDLPSAAEITLRCDSLAGVTIIDTPGVGGLDQQAVKSALLEARNAGVLIMVCDASSPITSPEMEILREAKETVGGVIVAVTKTDKNIRRWKSIISDNQRLIADHLGLDLPVIGVSSLRASDAAEIADPVRRAEIENRCGITALRQSIMSQLKQPKNIGERAAMQSMKTTLTTILRTVKQDIEVLNGSNDAVGQLETERNNLEKLREESSEFEQRFQRDLAISRNKVTDDLDKKLEDIKQHWQEQINRQQFRVLRSKPQVFTSQIETELRALMEQTVAEMLESMSKTANSLFTDQPEVIEEILSTAVQSLAPADVSGHTVEKKTKDIFDPSVISMGLIGSSLLSAVVPIAPVAGVVWVGVNLGFRAMRNGKQHLIVWLRETTNTTRMATIRMLDTVITSARTELMLRYRADLRAKIKELQARIDNARKVARTSEEERRERITRSQRNASIIESTVKELDAHLART